jgi:hypothetical protein
MGEVISEASFQEMIESQLEGRYLRKHDWPQASVSQAEALMRAQIALSGVEDPDSYYEQYSSTPGFASMLAQYVDQIQMMLFPAAARMQNMASKAELEYFISANYVPITARYVVFRAAMTTPSDEQLQAFYGSHPELFTDPPHSRIRYVVVGAAPDQSDFDRALGVVDSLAAAGGPADTIIMTRENVLAFTGIDSLTPQGIPSPPFAGPSLRGGMFQSVHEIMVLGVTPDRGDRTGAGDTVQVIHWEQPVYVGPDAIRIALYAAEDSRTTLLSTEVPAFDTLLVLDWGELYIEESKPLPVGLPQSLGAFALDSIWTDSIGPAFYVPSFRGGYPAFVVAKRLDVVRDTTVVTYEEALGNNRLLLTAYTRIQADSSMAMAARAMQDMADRGLTLGMYAQAESLEVATTPEFTAASVLQASAGDPEGYGGLLTTGEFGLAALVAPLLVPIGPFRTGGSAVIAEISSRSEMPMPGDPTVLTPLYLSVQAQHSFPAIRTLVDQLRRSSVISDLRTEYEAALDSARSNPPDPQVPIDY